MKESAEDYLLVEWVYADAVVMDLYPRSAFFRSPPDLNPAFVRGVLYGVLDTGLDLKLQIPKSIP